MMVFKLQCKFCNAECGKIEFPDDIYNRFHKGKELTAEYLGIQDVRCDSCREEHGLLGERDGI